MVTMNPSKLTFNQKKSIAARYTKGATGTSLAIQFGVSVSTIFNALRDFGVTIRPRGKQPANV